MPILSSMLLHSSLTIDSEFGLHAGADFDSTKVLCRRQIKLHNHYSTEMARDAASSDVAARKVGLTQVIKQGVGARLNDSKSC